MDAGQIADMVLDWVTICSVSVSVVLVWRNREAIRRLEGKNGKPEGDSPRN